MIYRTVIATSFCLALAGCAGIQVECGSDTGNQLNMKYRALEKQIALVKDGYREETEVISTPYVTQSCNAVGCVSQTNFHYNTITDRVPINMNYEVRLLQHSLLDFVSFVEGARDVQQACLNRGQGTFAIYDNNIQGLINQAKFLLD